MRSAHLPSSPAQSWASSPRRRRKPRPPPPSYTRLTYVCAGSAAQVSTATTRPTMVITRHVIWDFACMHRNITWMWRHRQTILTVSTLSEHCHGSCCEWGKVPGPSNFASSCTFIHILGTAYVVHACTLFLLARFQGSDIIAASPSLIPRRV